jgi:hypothetical protein
MQHLRAKVTAACKAMGRIILGPEVCSIGNEIKKNGVKNTKAKNRGIIYIFR